MVIIIRGECVEAEEEKSIGKGGYEEIDNLSFDSFRDNQENRKAYKDEIKVMEGEDVYEYPY
jgi:hypothetical protein